MRWRLSDLVCDHQTGRLRETALWSNVGKLAMTIGFVWTVFKGTPTEWLWATYGGVVVMHEVAARVMNQKQQRMDSEEHPT